MFYILSLLKGISAVVFETATKCEQLFVYTQADVMLYWSFHRAVTGILQGFGRSHLHYTDIKNLFLSPVSGRLCQDWRHNYVIQSVEQYHFFHCPGTPVRIYILTHQRKYWEITPILVIHSMICYSALLQLLN